MPHCATHSSNGLASPTSCQQESTAGTAQYARGEQLFGRDFRCILLQWGRTWPILFLFTVINTHHRYTDFQVNEINKAGEVVHLQEFYTNAKELSRAVSIHDTTKVLCHWLTLLPGILKSTTPRQTSLGSRQYYNRRWFRRCTCRWTGKLSIEKR